MDPKAEKILKEAADTVRQAFEDNKGYEKYIKLLPQSKNVGTKNNSMYIQFDVPYMTVEGRVRMCVDEHIKNKTKFKITPASFEQAPDGKTMICRVTVESLRGTVTGTAKVGLNGGGVDATNPYENAETSALGRALGFLGYGSLGEGIASYEEVTIAMSDEAAQKPALPQPQPGDEASVSLKLKIKQMLVAAGKTEEEADASVAGLTKEKAQEILIQLGKENAAAGQAQPQAQAPAAQPAAPAKTQPAAQPAATQPQAKKPTQPKAAADNGGKLKANEIMDLKKQLSDKIGDTEAGKLMSTVKTYGDVSRIKAEYALS